MTNELTRRDDETFEEWYQRFKAANAAKSSEELLSQFWQLFTMTAENFQNMAAIIRMVEEAGGDLSGPAQRLNGFFVALRRIAYGQLLPEILVRYNGKLTLVDRIGTLPISEQKVIAAGNGIPLLVYADDGSTSRIMAEPMDMTADQVRQAFARDHMRSENEQKLFLADWRAAKRKPLPGEVGEWRLDPELGIARRGTVVIALTELEAMVKILRRGKKAS
jgi:hypothetical protein